MSAPRRNRSGEYLSDELGRRVPRPQTQVEFQALFDDAANCRRYLASLRWPEGFVCPHCRRRCAAESSQRALLRCTACGFVCTPTTGTSLDRSHLPMSCWLRGIWELVSHESGANTERLRKLLPGSDPELVLEWLDAVQLIFDKPWSEPLTGLVELAKVPIELVVQDHRGRATSRHGMVAIAVEAKPRGELGAVRVRRLPRVDPQTMLGFVRSAVAPKTCIRTGPWRGYTSLRQRGYGHIVATRAEGDDAMTLVQQVASLLRLWLWSTRAVGMDRLDYYLSEFTFRFNARLHYAASDRAAMFDDILRLALDVPAVPHHTTRRKSG